MGAVLSRFGLARGTAVYELSSRGALCRYLRRQFTRVTVSELWDDVPPGSLRGGVQCQDVQRLTHGDSTFDLVTSTEVFEHVPDDRRAFAEVYRVLRPGGLLVFTVPLMDTGPTLERAEIRYNRIVHLVTPEYHGDRLRGRRGVLAFRTYGPDITDRLRAAGFDAWLERIEDPAHAITDGRVVVGRKSVVTTVARNIAANAAGAGLSFLVFLLAVPLYLRLLGAEAYGLVGLFTTVMVAAAALDLGLGATLNREVARLTAHEAQRTDVADVTATLQAACWLVGIVMGGLFALGAPAIATRWLNFSTLSAGEVRGALALMGVALPAIIVRGVYLAGLNGLQRQALANLLQTGGTTLRALVSVAALLLVAPTVRVFFVVQTDAVAGRGHRPRHRATASAARHGPGRPRALGHAPPAAEVQRRHGRHHAAGPRAELAGPGDPERDPAARRVRLLHARGGRRRHARAGGEPGDHRRLPALQPAGRARARRCHAGVSLLLAARCRAGAAAGRGADLLPRRRPGAVDAQPRASSATPPPS